MSAPRDEPPARWDPFLGWILLLAFLLRASLLVRYPAIGLWFDEVLHFAAGLAASEFGMGVVGHWAPGYEALVAGTFSAASPDPALVRWLQVSISTGTVACVYGIAGAAGGRRAARIAALLFSVYPSFVAFSHYLYSETLFIALLTAAVWVLARSDADGSRLKSALAGVLFGLATLTRSVVFYFLPLFAGWLWWRGDRPRARRLAIVFVACAAIVLPWTLRNLEVFGDFLLVDGTLGRSVYVAYNGRTHPFNVDLGFGLDPTAERRPPCLVPSHPGRAELPPVEELLRLVPEHALDARSLERLPSKLERVRGFAVQDTPALQRCEVANALAFVAGHPGSVLRQSFQRLYAFWGPNSFLLRSVHSGAYPGGPLGRDAYPFVKWSFALFYLVSMLAALLALCARPWPPVVQWIVGFSLYYTASHALTVSYSRYRLPLMPFVLVLAAWWLARPAWPRTPARRLAAVTLCALFLGVWAHYLLTRLP